MSQQGKFWQAVDNRSKKQNPAAVGVGTVKTLSPFSMELNGITLSVAEGDTIFLNNLLLDTNINLDKSTLDLAQEITEMTSPPVIKVTPETTSATYTAKISGTQKQFLIDFYDWVKSVHNRFILHIGDFIAVQKLGNNTYIVLEKLQKVEDEQ